MNPVELELVKMGRRWNQAVKQAGARPLIVFTGDKHETDLFDGLMKTNMASDDPAGDIYLLHYQDFDSSDTYGQVLYSEWAYFYKTMQQADYKDLPAWIEYEPDASGQAKTDASAALYPLVALQREFPEIRDQYIFLYLAPVAIADRSALADWVKHWCILCLQARVENIKLVWAEHHTHHTLPAFEFAHGFRFEMDIQQLMQQTAANTNRAKNSPDTDFQQQMLIASNHLSKSRYEEAQLALGNARKLARQMGNQDGELTALSMSAQGYGAARQKQEAESVYQQIFDLVEPRSLMEVQMYMSYGGFLLGESKKEKAQQAFLKAADSAEQQQNYAMALECHRTIGVLHDTVLSRSKMIAHYEKCLELGRVMDNESRQQSSLRYVASVLAQKRSGKEWQALQNEMQDYFGADWEVPTEAPASK